MKTPVYATVAAFTAANKVKWKWPNFTPKEVACKDGSIMVDTLAMDALQRMRDLVAAPLVVNSAYRSPHYNDKVGGAPRSYHMQAMAFDIALDGHDPHDLEACALLAGFQGIGRYPTFIHVDIGPARNWGGPWPYGEDDPAPAPAIDPAPAMVKAPTRAKAKALARAR